MSEANALVGIGRGAAPGGVRAFGALMLGGSGRVRLLDMHAQAQRGQHLEHGGKARVAVGRQRLVQPFAAQPGNARGLGHAARARHFAQRLGDEGGIVAGLFNGEL